MAIDISPISPFNPAFLRLSPSIMDSARPQIEPVGYNQRYGFVGPANPLQRGNETSPTYLRAFAAARPQAENEAPSVGTLSRDELDASIAFASRDEGVDQLNLFAQDESRSAATENARPASNELDRGIAEYAAVQVGAARAPAEQISVTV